MAEGADVAISLLNLSRHCKFTPHLLLIREVPRDGFRSFEVGGIGVALIPSNCQLHLIESAFGRITLNRRVRILVGSQGQVVVEEQEPFLLILIIEFILFLHQNGFLVCCHLLLTYVGIFLFYEFYSYFG